MFNPKLSSAVHEFATLMLPLSETDLERPWAWKDHDGEGIRFAFFVTLQELRHLAVSLATLRPRPAAVLHILSQYHAAYLDLQAALLGLSAEEAERAPAEGEWPVHKVYTHILKAEINFTITVRYALEKHRAGAWTPEEVTDADEDRLAGISNQEYEALVKSPLAVMQAYHRQFHHQIVEEFSAITNDELSLPVTFWEETRFPIHHRLHRYEAHLVQHTVQIDKAFTALGHAPSESKQLIRRLYAALAEAEGMMIGVERLAEVATFATASAISERTKEIERLLTGS